MALGDGFSSWTQQPPMYTLTREEVGPPSAFQAGGWYITLGDVRSIDAREPGMATVHFSGTADAGFGCVDVVGEDEVDALLSAYRAYHGMEPPPAEPDAESAPGMTPAEEAAFAAQFVQDYDNGPPGPLWLFSVNPDGTRRIALPSDVLGFIRHLLAKRQSKKGASVVRTTDDDTHETTEDRPETNPEKLRFLLEKHPLHATDADFLAKVRKLLGQIDQRYDYAEECAARLPPAHQAVLSAALQDLRAQAWHLFCVLDGRTPA